MPDQPMSPAELARQLGRLLKCYLPEGDLSAHEAVEILSAFEHGLSEERRHMAEVKLPLIPRIDDDSTRWDGYFPIHQLTAETKLLLSIGADFLCVEVLGDTQQPDGKKPTAAISVDHNGCGQVRLKTTRHGKAQAHRLPQWM